TSVEVPAATAKRKPKESSQTARATLALRQMLLEGRFQPGERIREVPLAAELGVSRIPLRLVLERLAQKGLVVIRATRGFVPQFFSTSDIYEAIDVRGLLEGMSARLAAERYRDPKDISILENLNREIAQLVRRKRAEDHLENYVDL